MQDRYVGDVGDFGKYCLLRALAPGRPDILRLGVVWCRYPDESHNGDGQHVRYLSNNEYKALDPHVHQCLARLVESNARSIAGVQSSSIFPKGTLFFDNVASGLSGSGTVVIQRKNYRHSWLEAALQATKRADLVFFDPDNGIETPSIPKTSNKAGKYIFWDEMLPFWSRGQSLVVYHHLNRTRSAIEQTEALRRRFLENFGSVPLLTPLLFRRGSCRHFWIVGQERHSEILTQRIKALLASGWKRHFESC